MCPAQVPRWACFVCCLGLFIYQSLDAIDGKQARRTNTQSPLGELFDHGCDSLSTGWILVVRYFRYLTLDFRYLFRLDIFYVQSPLGELFDHGCNSLSTGWMFDIFYFRTRHLKKKKNVIKNGNEAIYKAVWLHHHIGTQSQHRLDI